MHEKLFSYLLIYFNIIPPSNSGLQIGA